ncbi:hypothetical protein ACQKJG_26105 [Priestia megaterium]|uniref:hypothetical protein n=1 Tax=Priestia megaterium TaxID=1404 RepID=UPI003D0174C1
MKHISVIDYIGNCNESGEATGHVLKTLKDARITLENNFTVSMILTKDYTKYFKQKDIKYKLNLSSKINFRRSKISRLFFQVQKLYFTRSILNREDRMWFVNTDFWLFVSLIFFKKRNHQKIYVTNYIDYYASGGIKKNFKNFIFKKALHKIDCVFTTNANVQVEKHVYIPDYSFNKSIYSNYMSEYKKSQVYMCGGINEAKDVDGLVDAFINNGEKLLIKGNFQSEDKFKYLSGKASSNIEIYAGHLNEDEYYKNIAENQFIVLPYKKENYNNRSSGVILESIFLKAIVIAPNYLLKQLGIDGIGYDDINELSNFHINEIPPCKIEKILQNNSKLLERYDSDIIQKRYLSNFN